jgi:DNA-binding response OmpR family regulator
MNAKTVLIVEDDQDQTLLLVSLLKRNGYDVISASDAVFAITTARNERPDVILLDIHLPGGDGFLVLERLKAVEQLTTTPVIVMTAFDKHVEDRALKEGAVALKKPIDKNTLLATVRRAVSHPDEREEMLS